MHKNPLKNLSDQDLARVAAFFRALGEVSRLQLLSAMNSDEKSVTALVDATGLSQPNVSRHLAALFVAGVITKRKKGSSVQYRIINGSLSEVCALACKQTMSHHRNHRS